MTPTETLLATHNPEPVFPLLQVKRFVVTLPRAHPLMASALADVRSWAVWPGTWAPDCGMDAVAHTHDARTIAIQAKAYAPCHCITNTDLYTFVSESARPGVDGRMVVATTDHLATNAARLCADLNPPVTRVLRLHLDRALDGSSIPAGSARHAPARR